MLFTFNKSLLLLGAMLLVGAGVYTQWVATAVLVQKGRRSWQRGAITGASLVFVASLLDIFLTLRNVLGYTTMPLLYDYTLNTRHGSVILLRLALTILVMFFVWRDRSSYLWKAVTAVFSVALLGTFSWVSHAAAMGGTPAIVNDVLHFIVAASWAGTILYLALTPLAKLESERWELDLTFDRTSRIGLSCVIILGVTGSYATSLHVYDPVAFAQSAYGATLFVKLALVAVILGIAAINRFRLLPAFAKTGNVATFQRALRLEALLLVSVFIITGILSTRPLPHAPVTHLPDNAVSLTTADALPYRLTVH
jgi:putative copper export protein